MVIGGQSPGDEPVTEPLSVGSPSGPHTPRQTGGSRGISQADISSFCHALIKGGKNHPDDWSLTSSIYITSPRLATPF